MFSQHFMRQSPARIGIRQISCVIGKTGFGSRLRGSAVGDYSGAGAGQAARQSMPDSTAGSGHERGSSAEVKCLAYIHLRTFSPPIFVDLVGQKTGLRRFAYPAIARL
jgi:hypothetical protein